LTSQTMKYDVDLFWGKQYFLTHKIIGRRFCSAKIRIYWQSILTEKAKR